MDLLFVTAKVPPTHCGVGDYCVAQAARLKARGVRCAILTSADQTPSCTEPAVVREVRDWQVWGQWSVAKTILQLHPRRVVIQWVPYLYARHGINFGVPFLAALLRLRGIPCDVMVHELWIHPDWGFRTLVSVAQRFSLFLLASVTRNVFVSTAGWTHRLRKHLFWKKSLVRHAPVGSNIPVQSQSQQREQTLRHSCGLSPQDKIGVMFSIHNAAATVALLQQGWDFLAQRGWQLIIIGNLDPKVADAVNAFSHSERVHRLGRVDEVTLSHWLHISDLALAPFVDGLSTRRGSVMALLSHGVPTISTSGHNYDGEIFDSSPVVIAPLEAGAFVNELSQLTERVEQDRQSLRAAVRTFYQQSFNDHELSQPYYEALS